MKKGGGDKPLPVGKPEENAHNYAVKLIERLQ